MILFIFMAVFSAGAFVESADSDVAQAFKDNDIVPDIILEAPQDLIQVNYTTRQVNLGTKVYPTQTLFKPRVAFDTEDSEFYTLVFLGPDLLQGVSQTTSNEPETTLPNTTLLPLIPPSTQFLHWLIVNIPGTNVEDGVAVVPYFPPISNPLGQFNYIFLLYKQNATINASELTYLSIIRSRFDVTDFQRKYKLTGPLAGNFMKEVYGLPNLFQL